MCELTKIKPQTDAKKSYSAGADKAAGELSRSGYFEHGVIWETAKQWRDEHPDDKGNIRLRQCYINLENLSLYSTGNCSQAGLRI